MWGSLSLRGLQEHHHGTQQPLGSKASQPSGEQDTSPSSSDVSAAETRVSRHDVMLLQLLALLCIT